MGVSYYKDNKSAYEIAYVHTQSTNQGEHLPCVMFLGGFKSDMEGTKATFLEAQCKMRGQEFVRFDYSGHGLSGGEFEDGTISSWTGDALAILDNVVQSKSVVMVGSSMGGWVALLALIKNPERLKAVIGIAAAPDFSKDVKAELTPEQ